MTEAQVPRRCLAKLEHSSRCPAKLAYTEGTVLHCLMFSGHGAAGFQAHWTPQQAWFDDDDYAIANDEPMDEAALLEELRKIETPSSGQPPAGGQRCVNQPPFAGCEPCQCIHPSQDHPAFDSSDLAHRCEKCGMAWGYGFGGLGMSAGLQEAIRSIASPEAHEQPLPTPGAEDVQSALIEHIRQRRNIGITRYGTALQTHNGRDAIRDALEEALDLATYLMQVQMEIADKDELLYEAWAVIANASEGWAEGYTKDEWKSAAERWRDRWHATLKKGGQG